MSYFAPSLRFISLLQASGESNPETQEGKDLREAKEELDEYLGMTKREIHA